MKLSKLTKTHLLSLITTEHWRDANGSEFRRAEAGFVTVGMQTFKMHVA